MKETMPVTSGLQSTPRSLNKTSHYIVIHRLSSMMENKSQDYKVIKKLGEGSFGEVFLAENRKTGACYAMKVYLDEVDEHEISVLKRLRHAHIVQYRDLVDHGGKDAVLMEYCSMGDLKGFLGSQSKPLDEGRIWIWFGQLSAAVAHCHAQNIVHRDLKPANILIHNNELKVSDFGLATMMNKLAMLMSTSKVRGTPLYMAPELFSKNPQFGPSSDIWALGCIVYQMCTLKPAFVAIMSILNEEPEAISDQFSSALWKGITKMIEKNPEKRPTIRDILKWPDVQRNLADALRDEEYINEPREKSETRVRSSKTRSPPSATSKLPRQGLRRLPEPYTSEMLAMVKKENFKYWKKFQGELVPFLCNEEGKFLVDWGNVSDQWKFGDFGRNNWRDCANEGDLSILIGCALALPRQLKETVVELWFWRTKNAELQLRMYYHRSTAEDTTALSLTCNINLTFHHKDGKSSTELDEKIECRLKSWKEGLNVVFMSQEALPFSRLSPDAPPIMQLQLVSADA